jgi:hypothetical protein
VVVGSGKLSGPRLKSYTTSVDHKTSPIVRRGSLSQHATYDERGDRRHQRPLAAHGLPAHPAERLFGRRRPRPYRRGRAARRRHGVCSTEAPGGTVVANGATGALEDDFLPRLATPFEEAVPQAAARVLRPTRARATQARVCDRSRLPRVTTSRRGYVRVRVAVTTACRQWGHGKRSAVIRR